MHLHLAEHATSRVAAAPVPEPPSDAEKALLEQAMLLELTARDLYQEALAADAASSQAALVGVIAANHEAYAQSIAGVGGLSAQGRNEDVYEALREGFLGDFVLSAHSLEQTAVATHSSLLGSYSSLQAIELTASILVVEARHATVLADIAGVDDLDVVFGNAESPLDLEASA